MHCLRCKHPLPDAVDGECPNCGLQFDAARPVTYEHRPPFLLWNYWLPGFLLSVISGVVSYSVCLMGGEGDMGWALFVAVPVSAGAILGYATRTRYWALILLGLAATASIVFGLVVLNLAGVFCGLTLSLIFLAPLFFGLTLGVALRYFLKATSWSQRWYLPLLALAALPYITQWVEDRFPRRTEIATVRTELHVHATPREAWDAIMFYEEVHHEPPLLLNLALPKPLGSEGRKDRVGEIVRCQYDRGWLVKRISRVEPGRLMEFEVIEQHLHFERDVTLTGGSFRIAPQPDGTAQIVLTTRYQRHLHPGWIWTPVEKTVVHTLHGHVLEGMRRRAERETEFDDDSQQPYAPNSPTPDEDETAQFSAGNRHRLRWTLGAVDSPGHLR